jgi:acetyltransferase
MTADACASRGLELPRLSDTTVLDLTGLLREEATVDNPIDMTAESTVEQYSRSLQLLAQDNQVDIVIVIFIPPILTQAEDVARAIRDIAPEFRRQGKVLVASFMGSKGASIELGSEEQGYVPSFTFPEDAATALSKACQYSDWLRRPKGIVPKFDNVDKKKAKSIIKSAVEKVGTQPLWLDTNSTAELLNSYGIRTVRSKPARSVEETVSVAEEMGFPVALKLLSSTITHKTEVGGVRIDLRSPEEVKQAFYGIKDNLTVAGRGNEMEGVVVQHMVLTGIEIIVGITQDSSFGSLIMFGMGGTQAELFKDVVFRIHPLTDVDAREMVHSVKAYQLLEGWRGAKRCDVDAVEDLLLRVSAMAEDLPQIVELDLNPVKVQTGKNGYHVVDARIMLS